MADDREIRITALEDAKAAALAKATRWGNDRDDAFNEGCREAAQAIDGLIEATRRGGGR